ncbi:MAG: glycosyltransferase, partial [Balneolaceae bacterium]
PYIQNASVYVVPLRMGGGTRLKIIEALAIKKPLVTTSIGCEGIDIEHRKSALIADNPQHFADAVMELFANKELCEDLTTNGYEIVINKYRWKSIGNHIDRAYEKLTGIKSNNNNNAKKTGQLNYVTNGII